MKQGDAVWITRYALTKGIIQSRVRDVSGSGYERVYIPKSGWGFRVGTEAWDNPVDAQEEAERMRDAAIDECECKLERLRGKKIKVVVQ